MKRAREDDEIIMIFFERSILSTCNTKKDFLHVALHAVVDGTGIESELGSGKDG